MSLGRSLRGLAAVALSMSFGATTAIAGQAGPWQMGFQTPATPVMARIVEFNNLLLVIIVAIVCFTTALLLYTLWRFSAKRNPQPSRVTHNTVIEVLWTAAPIVILVVIAIPSFKLLYFMDRAQDAEMTIKAIGYQWYWSYEYPDHGNFTFDALMLGDDELGEGQPRLLATDNAVVVPVDTTIRILTTADDVIHAWAVPAFGVKIDATPGRLNEAWFRVESEGVYYGQCSELCGAYHGFMPIAVEVVSKEAFAEWVEKARVEFARDDAPARVAQAAPGGAYPGSEE